MLFLKIVMFGFVLLEISNAYVLFFFPESSKVHGMGMFPAWQKAKEDPNIHNLLRYFTFWVAGSKLIMSALMVIILVWGGDKLLVITSFALVISMLPFYFGLFPTMKKIDENGQVEPSGFSYQLAFTITALILSFLIGSITVSLN